MKPILRNSELTPTVGLQKNMKYVVVDIMFSLLCVSLESWKTGHFCFKVKLWVGALCVLWGYTVAVLALST